MARGDKAREIRLRREARAELKARREEIWMKAATDTLEKSCKALVVACAAALLTTVAWIQSLAKDAPDDGLISWLGAAAGVFCWALIAAIYAYIAQAADVVLPGYFERSPGRRSVPELKVPLLALGGGILLVMVAGLIRFVLHPAIRDIFDSL